LTRSGFWRNTGEHGKIQDVQMRQIQAIIFDLDGTLIDSIADLAASVNHSLIALGFAARSVEEIRGFVGDGVQKLIARSLGDASLGLQKQALQIFMRYYGDHLLDHTHLYDGVTITLEALRNDYRLAVLTNKGEGFTNKILNGLGVAHYFAAVIGGDTLTVKKPEPAAIFHLSSIWRIPPARMLMVGDHATDIQVGINAGCRTVFFTNGIGRSKDLAPDAVIHAITELPAVAAQFNG
jgi:phosphoglycolate phosphatase